MNIGVTWRAHFARATFDSFEASYHIKHNVQIGWKQRRDIRKSRCKRQAAADMTLLIALSFK